MGCPMGKEAINTREEINYYPPHDNHEPGELYLIKSQLDRIEYYFKNTFIPEFLTIKEAAILLRVSQSTIRRLFDSGEIKYFKINDSKNSKIIIERQEIDRYLNKHLTGK
jgi:excisionase family DNA binding protein